MFKKLFLTLLLCMASFASTHATLVRGLELRSGFSEEEPITVKSIHIKNGSIVSSTHEEGDILKKGHPQALKIVVSYDDSQSTELPFQAYRQSLIEAEKDIDYICIGNEKREIAFGFYPHTLSPNGCYPLSCAGVKCQVLRSGVSTIYAISSKS